MEQNVFQMTSVDVGMMINTILLALSSGLMTLVLQNADAPHLEVD